MSLTLLLEKYDVSTEEGLQKAFSEIEKEELEVDEALCNAMSRASSLEGRLRAASQAYTKLGAVKVDAQSAADMVEKTATLAQDVSAKVRQLDLARSRVAECQRRVHDLIDLQLCSTGVEAALKAHDLETGAAHVSRFLSMSEGSVAAARRTAPDAPDPRRAIAAAADKLHEHLVNKFNEASRKEDDASVERLFKLFPQIGREDDGLQLFAKYLAAQVESQIRGHIKSLEPGDEAAFAVALTRVAERGAAATRRVLAALPRRGALEKVLPHLQLAVSTGARRVYTEMVSRRQLATLLSRKPTALAVETSLQELSHAHCTLALYTQAIRNMHQVDTKQMKDEDRARSMAAVSKILSESELTRTQQDILGHYLSIERYFLEESVNKALKMSSTATDSSLVDDVFYIARKVIRRAASTRSIDGLCCVVNECSALLERAVAAWLRRALRAAPAPDVLPLVAPGGGGGGGGGAGDALLARINRDHDAQNKLFLAHMNEAELGAEWSERLAAEACGEGEHLIQHATERDKLQSCASGLASAAAAFRAAHETALSGIRAALKPKIYAWADVLANNNVCAEDLEEEDVDALPAALDGLLSAGRVALSEGAADAVLLACARDLAARAEAALLQCTTDRIGGLCLERRSRRLAAWAGGVGGVALRETCARLVHAAALLALEAPEHAAELRTLHPRAKDILARRVDFKMEDIKRLKL